MSVSVSSVVRGAAFLAVACGLAAFAVTQAPRVVEAVAYVEAQDDPVALTRLGLARDFTAERFRAELAAALDAEDIDLAESFLELGAQQGLVAPADLEARYRLAVAPAAKIGRAHV